MSAEDVKVNSPTPWGYIDRILTDPCGIIRLYGWKYKGCSIRELPTIYLDSFPIPFLQRYLTYKHDLSQENQELVLEYLVPEALRNRILTALSLSIAGRVLLDFHSSVSFISPAYPALLNSPEVLHREHIYGSGPPNIVMAPEVIALAQLLDGRILDFGCGSGALVRSLRAMGKDAHGIELDNPVIRAHTNPDVQQFITFYDGLFPAPYPDQSFTAVFCSEVLEHIPQFEQAVAEVSRLASERVIITVPDMSAIPWGFRHGLIPWHLLEATHVNFFTQASLERLLSRYFSNIEFGRICSCKINDTVCCLNIVADCRR